jgi:hypothetical protein
MPGAADIVDKRPEQEVVLLGHECGAGFLRMYAIDPRKALRHRSDFRHCGILP